MTWVFAIVKQTILGGIKKVFNKKIWNQRIHGKIKY
jgi:hypothetical protein